MAVFLSISSDERKEWGGEREEGKGRSARMNDERQDRR